MVHNINCSAIKATYFYHEQRPKRVIMNASIRTFNYIIKQRSIFCSRYRNLASWSLIRTLIRSVGKLERSKRWSFFQLKTNVTILIDGHNKTTKSASYNVHNTDWVGRFTINDRWLVVVFGRNKTTKNVSYNVYNTDRVGRFPIKTTDSWLL